MRKLLVSGIVALFLAVPAAAGAATTVPIYMHDPGCHSFFVKGKFYKSFTARGSVTLRDFDEAALVVRGPSGTHKFGVGKSLTLKARGVYHITMVHQASDDNHLTLTIK